MPFFHFIWLVQRATRRTARDQRLDHATSPLICCVQRLLNSRTATEQKQRRDNLARNIDRESSNGKPILGEDRFTAPDPSAPGVLARRAREVLCVLRVPLAS
jgi:hypothetical protein